MILLKLTISRTHLRWATEAEFLFSSSLDQFTKESRWKCLWRYLRQDRRRRYGCRSQDLEPDSESGRLGQQHSAQRVCLCVPDAVWEGSKPTARHALENQNTSPRTVLHNRHRAGTLLPCTKRVKASSVNIFSPHCGNTTTILPELRLHWESIGRSYTAKWKSLASK